MVSEPFSLNRAFDPTMSSSTNDNTNASATGLIAIGNTSLITIGNAVQISVKLTAGNFPSWRAQLQAILIGHDLLRFVDGTHPCPPLDSSGSASSERTLWIRQDQLLLSAIFGSVSEPILPLIAFSETSQEALKKLTNLYANKSRSRVMFLKDQLSTIRRQSRSVSEYLQELKGIADELSIIDTPLQDDDIVIQE